MPEDDIIIKEYREAFRKYAKDGVVDLDSRLKHKFNFQITRLEDMVRELQGVIPPMRTSQFFVTLVRSGAGEKTIGLFTFPFHKNTLLIIPSRVTHSSRYWSMDCSGYFLSFNVEFFLQNAFPKQHIENKIIFKSSVRPYLILADRQVDVLLPIYEALITEYKGQQNRKNEMLAIKVLELVLQCDRFYTDAESRQHESIYNATIQEFNELIQKNFATERTVGFYAKALHMHPNHLNSLVKKYTGLTAKETINDFILCAGEV